MAIQLDGVSAGAAAMGVAATTFVLVVNSWKVNKSGVTIAIALGAMKMMMPNLFRKPVILIPCLVSAVITAIPVALFFYFRYACFCWFRRGRTCWSVGFFRCRG